MSCPAPQRLAELRGDRLTVEERRRLTDHLARCTLCQTELLLQDAEVQEFEQRMPERWRAVSGRLRRASVHGPGPRGHRTLMLGVGAAAAATLAALLLISLKPPPAPRALNTRFKGDLTLQVFAKRSSSTFRVTPGAALLPGDALRFVVTSSAPGYITIFSLDAHGVLTPFYPDTDPTRDPEPLRLTDRGRTTLPGSVVLDDTLGPEHLVLVFSLDLFSRRNVHTRAEQLLGSSRTARTPERPLTADGLGIRGEVRVLSVHKASPSP